MGRLPEMVRFGSLDGIRCREAGAETIIEARGHHRRLPGGTPMTLDYVWFITRRDGRVVHFRDYMNPLQLASG
ncbi:nuclear transport factor 2 family protein [Rhizosaccharibacter radicis]|uniref:SnoaL-like domain-containing protein n=1 Tax=Rhizosaccharibacter radicis TaxID=2782605 RepID=A0ABT1VZS3_9PROT|nr:hypothetical protein [Acetobacteraceae bacterium KSS12]